MQKVHKKASRKTISANPERQIFEIFTLVPTMVTSQGDAKLEKLLARPKKSWIRMFKSKKKMTVWLQNPVSTLDVSDAIANKGDTHLVSWQLHHPYSLPWHLGFDLSFWSAVLKIYPFVTS